MEGEAFIKSKEENIDQGSCSGSTHITMSCFKISDSLYDKMTSLAWISREKLCISKAQEGMGFKLLKEFNLALLAKQGWKLQTYPNSLVYWVLKDKYFPDCEFLDPTLIKMSSYIWWSMMEAQHIIG